MRWPVLQTLHVHAHFRTAPVAFGRVIGLLFGYYLQLQDTNGNANRDLRSILDSFQITVKMKRVERAATRSLMILRLQPFSSPQTTHIVMLELDCL